MPRHSRRAFLKTSGALLGGFAASSTVVAAERADRFIVRTPGTDAAALERAGLSVVYDLSGTDVAVVSGTESAVESAASSYAPDVEVRLDAPAVNEASPAAEARDEPLYPYQWDKQMQSIPEVHDVTRGEGTRVAVVDSGVAAGHPDLDHAVNVSLSRNFTDDDYGAGVPAGGYHGTHVAGIVAADDGNDAGVAGSAPGTEVVDCRVFSTEEGASFADILAALHYSAEIGCDAANLSIGAYPIPRTDLKSFYGAVLNSVFTHASAAGTVPVVAAGNDGADLQHDDRFISLPNEAARAVSVSATGPIGFGFDAGDDEAPPETPAVYTNYGTNAIDVAAPGGNFSAEAYVNDVEGWYFDLVVSTVADPVFEDGEYVGAEYGYSWAAGTSMAAPQVAAAVALVRSVDPDSSTGEVRSRLASTATVPDGYDRTYYGSGLLDPLAAVTK